MASARIARARRKFGAENPKSLASAGALAVFSLVRRECPKREQGRSDTERYPTRDVDRDVKAALLGIVALRDP